MIEICATSVLGINLAEHYYPQEAALFWSGYHLCKTCHSFQFLAYCVLGAGRVLYLGSALHRPDSPAVLAGTAVIFILYSIANRDSCAGET